MKLIDVDDIGLTDFEIVMCGGDYKEALTILCQKIDNAEEAIIRCKDCKHYYFTDNRIPQEQRYVCDLDGDRWKPDSFCSFGERKENR